MKYYNIRGCRKDILIFFVIAVFSFLTTFTFHKGKDRFNWHSEIWADKAGYYIYLPATFFFHFDINKVPAGLDERTGNGFVCDKSTGKISTHFYYGESLLISPFFLAVHLYSGIFHLDEDDGFSIPYHRAMDFAALLYFLLGIWFLRKFLSNYLSQNLSWLVILVTFLGTNLMFYSLEDTLMSHVFSFSMGAVFLFLTKKFIEDMSDYKWFLLLSVVFAVMIVIRPTNGIIATGFLFLDAGSFKDILQRLKVLLKPKHILAALIILIILAAPQLFYWKYLCGRFTIPPYGGAGFGNWDHPRFLQVWFSTVNGLFAYCPVLLFFIAGMIFMIFKKIPNGIWFMVMFLLVSYMAAAWRNWYWGGTFGHRAFVEFYSLFCLPFGYLMQEILVKREKVLNILLVVLVVVFTFFNFRLTLSVMMEKNFKSFFGSTWDLGEYSRVLSRAGLIWPLTGMLTYTNDFENEQQTSSKLTSDQIAHSGMYSLKARPQEEYVGTFYRFMWEFAFRYPKQVRVQLWVNKPFEAPTGAFIVFSIEKDGKPVKWVSTAFDRFIIPAKRWTKLESIFSVPEKIDGEYRMMVYIWNFRHKPLYIDDIKISYE